MGQFLIPLRVDRTFVEAGNLLRRVREWAFGEYDIVLPSGIVQVNVTAAIGVAEWDGKESPGELFNRADQLMYADKRAVPAPGARGMRGRRASVPVEKIAAGMVRSGTAR